MLLILMQKSTGRDAMVSDITNDIQLNSIGKSLGGTQRNGNYGENAKPVSGFGCLQENVITPIFCLSKQHNTYTSL